MKHRRLSIQFIVFVVTALFLIRSLPLASLCSAKDWPRFLGAHGAATSSSARIPTEWNASKNIQWKTAMPGPGSSSPVVLDDRIYLTCYSGYGDGSDGAIEDLTRHLLCIDRAHGEILWQRSVDNKQVKNEDPYTSYITEHGYATSTPVTDGQSLYVFFNKAGVVAFDLDGNELWQTDIPSRPTETRWGSAASPILHLDKVIVNAIEECGKLFALSKEDGRILWEFDAQAQLVYSTPNLLETSGGEIELVLGIPEKVIGIDPANGKEKWFAKTTLLNEVNAAVMVRGDIAYIYGGYQGVGSLAIRGGGKGDVTQSHVLWSSTDSSYVATPVLKDDHIYWLNKSGIAFCVEAGTGKKIYQQRVAGIEGGRGVKVFASAVVAGDHVYVVSRRSGTFVLAATPEFKLISQNTIEGDDTDFNGTPAISNDQMFLRSNKFLYCISN